MRRRLAKMAWKLWISVAFLVWLAAWTGTRAGGVPQTPAAGKSAAPTNSSQSIALAAGATYVGEKSCLGCHEEQRASYERSPHHWANDPRTPAAKQGCETCHGPGSKHAEDPDHVKVVNDSTKPARFDVVPLPSQSSSQDVDRAGRLTRSLIYRPRGPRLRDRAWE